jgi:hypothetical protein
MKDRIKALLDNIDPEVKNANEALFVNYEKLDDIDVLTKIGIAVKKLHDTQGAK